MKTALNPEIIRQIDSIHVNLNAGGMNTINIVLAFVMFGVALGIKPKMFLEVFKKPKAVIVGLLCQLVLLPAMTFCLALAFGKWISWTMALGMILVAACPGGNISNFISSLSKGNIELSVSLTAITTALAVLMTPFNFWAWGNLFLQTADITADLPKLSIPLWEVFKTIFILLGVPLTAGILCSHYLPKLAEKLKKPLQWVSIAFFLVMVILSFWSNREAFLRCIQYIFLVVLIHNLMALLIGCCTSAAFRLGKRELRTITIETGIQNSGLGLALMLGTGIFTDCFGDIPFGGMLVITAWWGIWHIVSGLTAAGIFNLSDYFRSRKRQ